MIGDELAGEIVDPGQTGGSPRGQARKLPAELHGQVHEDVPRVAVDDVLVVEYPLRRRRRPLLQPGCLREIDAHLVHLATGVLETGTQLDADPGTRLRPVIESKALGMLAELIGQELHARARDIVARRPALRVQDENCRRDVAALPQEGNGQVQDLDGRLENDHRLLRHQPARMIPQHASPDAMERARI